MRRFAWVFFALAAFGLSGPSYASFVQGGGTATPTGAAGGNLGGTYPNPIVAKVNGTTVPAGGALTTGNACFVSGASACTYSALNLAGGPGWISGLLPVANGGTGASSLTAHGLLIGESTSAIASTAACTAGQLIFGQGASADPACETVSGDMSCTSAGVCSLGNIAGAVTASNTFTVALSNTNASLTTGTPHLVLNNTNSSGQTLQLFEIQGAVKGGIRSDLSGNFNWHANSSAQHVFYNSLDTSIVGEMVSQHIIGLFTSDGALSGGDKEVRILNGTPPTSAPSSGGLLYENNGAFSHTGSGGEATTMAPAGAGTVNTQLQTHRRFTQYGRITTSGNTITINIPLATSTSGTAIHVTGLIKIATAGSLNAAGDFFADTKDATFKNVAGTVSQVGSAVDLTTGQSDTSLNTSAITFGVSTTNVVITLTATATSGTLGSADAKLDVEAIDD